MNENGLKHLDLRQISYFKAIVENGTISAAAKACGVSQPTISAQIATIEQFLGKTLLERTKKGANLTPEGEIFLKYSNRLLQEERLLIREITKDDDSEDETVSFGASTGVTSFIVEHALSDVLVNHPHMRINYVEDRVSRLIELLENRTIDLAVISELEVEKELPNTLHKRRYFNEEILLAVGQNHRLAYSTKPISLDTIKDDNIIKFTKSHCLNKNILDILGEDIKSTIEVDQMSSGLGMVAKNLGVMLMPIISSLSYQRGDVIYKRFEAPIPRRAICIMHRRKEKLPANAKPLLRGIKSLPSFESV